MGAADSDAVSDELNAAFLYMLTSTIDSNCFGSGSSELDSTDGVIEVSGDSAAGSGLDCLEEVLIN
jgi:hypothetical protein